MTCPYSLLHVALADEDRTRDDPIGRIVIDLGQLNQRTQYDSWYPLQYGHLKRHAGKLGVVRLRKEWMDFNHNLGKELETGMTA